ncbi:carboxypeptidase regulatory-like domain-containing protein [Paenibacillus spongiae]|uniref:Carboxypeptidase regulatory-like domain-containing protein n=1 Tax=Paenibacillus spongiae TaxID=2909671 RepID=A0ABY5S0I4_9BACL|nr:carboxypeptidase regulatory-like domain-containing protein [Paenibacillus spongiae]UVI27356.1 carboxypeptidase regulatory-like domain-containing protein [Paenibacillus spongiae]
MKETARSSEKIIAILMFFLIFSVTTNVGVTSAEGSNEVIRSLHGTITDENGNPVNGASIQVGTYTLDGGIGFQIVASAITNADGVYDIPSYTRYLGDVVFTLISANGYLVVNTLKSETFDYQFPAQRATVTGKITYGDTYETPVVNYPLAIGVHLGPGGRMINVVAPTLTDEEGKYSFTIIPGIFDSYIGENYFRIIYDGMYERRVELYVGDNKTLEHNNYDPYVPIPEGVKLNGTIWGYVADENDNIIHDAVVELVGANTSIYKSQNVFYSDVIKGGTYTLKITAPGFRPVEQVIEINGGSAYLPITLTKNNPPVVKASADRMPDHNGWYNKDVTVSFQAADDDGILSVDSPVLVSTEGIDQVIEGKATDSSGATGTGSIKINLDKTSPITNANVSENPNENGWYNHDVLVTLTATDNLSNVVNTEYSLDNGNTWMVYNGKITISKEGENVLHYRSADGAGNTEQPKSIEVNIDKTLPILKITLNKSVLFPPNHKMVSIEATIETMDTLSGLDSITLTSISSNEKGSDKDIQNAAFGTYDTSFDLRAERSGKGGDRVYTITYTAIDKAGNVAKGTATVTVKHNR